MAADIRSKDQPFYIPLSKHQLTPGFRDLLEHYSNIPSDKVTSHLEAIRDDAWNHYPCPSIGLFVFTDLGVSGDDLLPHADAGQVTTITEAYKTILSMLKSGGKFLDVGCMFAQDTRKLVHDGVSPQNVYGIDLHGGYFDFAYKLFRDEKVIPKDHFIAADILDENNPELKALEGQLSVINATHIINVFNISDQKVLLNRFISLLRPEVGVMVTGRITGHLEAGYHEMSNAKATVKDADDKIWEHNVESFKELWREVGEETGTHWDVDAWFWRLGSHTGGEGKLWDWHRTKEHGLVTFIVTRF